jgi:hypothetical protein
MVAESRLSPLLGETSQLIAIFVTIIKHAKGNEE